MLNYFLIYYAVCFVLIILVTSTSKATRNEYKHPIYCVLAAVGFIIVPLWMLIGIYYFVYSALGWLFRGLAGIK